MYQPRWLNYYKCRRWWVQSLVGSIKNAAIGICCSAKYTALGVEQRLVGS